jgi:CRP-like cAMP-binding protein
MLQKVPKEVIEMLRSVPLFSECTTRELRQIGNIGTHMQFPDGRMLTEQGQTGREFFLLLDGKARCLIDGTEVANFGPGDFFGEMALLDQGPRHATVITDGPASVLVLDSREFSTLLRDAPPIARNMLSVLAKRERVNASPHS